MRYREDAPRWAIHSPSFRYYLLAKLDREDRCLRFFFNRNRLFLYYPTIVMQGDLTRIVSEAFLDSFLNPVEDDLRNVLRRPPGELLGRVHGRLLHQMEYIEYQGDVIFESEQTGGEERGGGKAHKYVISLKKIDDIFAQERLEYDKHRALQCLEDESEGISEELLIKKYTALYVLPLSHYRARKILKAWEEEGRIENNGNKRTWGRDIIHR